ncbi:MAG: hypothetical protein WCJ81_02945 [bacterium]
MAVTKHNEGYLIGNTVFIMGESKPDKKYVNLALQTGEDMHYGDHNDLFVMDYPGEYDIHDRTFKVFAGKGGELNYLMNDGNKVYAFVQTEDALNNEEFNADYWLFAHPHISKMIDKMELEGEKIDLSTLE